MFEIRTQLAQEVEAVEGTAETLLAADAIAHMAGKFAPNIDMHKRPLRSTSLSPFAAKPGARNAVIEFDVELKGSGTAGTAPEFGDLIRACGFLETIVAGTSVTYTPASDSIPSLSLALYEDGIANKIWGARGTFKISLDQGKPGMVHFVFTGADFSVSDVALLAGTSFQTTLPPVAVSPNLVCVLPIIQKAPAESSTPEPTLQVREGKTTMLKPSPVKAFLWVRSRRPTVGLFGSRATHSSM